MACTTDTTFMPRVHCMAPIAIGPSQAEFCARLLAEAAPALASLGPTPVEPDPEAEYEREHGVQCCPSRWVEAVPAGADEREEAA